MSVSAFAKNKLAYALADQGAANEIVTQMDDSVDNTFAAVQTFTLGWAVGNTGTMTVGEGADFVLGTTTGTKIGTAVGQKLAFHNSTPVVQRTGAAQAAAATTAATTSTAWGFFTQAQADGITTLLNELRAAMVEKGLIKGGA